MTLAETRPDLRETTSGITARAQQLLEVAAVWGPSFALEDMAKVIGDPPAWLLPPMAELQGAGILTVQGDAVVFVDGIEHQRIYEEIPRTVRAALHHQIGALLLERGGAAASAAEHLVLAARPNGREALPDLDRATAVLLESSPGSAAEIALRALEMTEPTDGARFPRTLTAVDALVRAGRPAEASNLAQATIAAMGVPRAQLVDLRLIQASVSFACGRPDVAIAEAEAARGRAGPDELLHAQADLVQVLAVLSVGDVDETRRAAGAVMARRSDDTALAAALTAWAFIAWDDGRVADALGFVRAAIERAGGGSAPPRRVHPRLALAAMLTALGEWHEAESAISDVAEEIASTHDAMWAAGPLAARARLRLAQGRLDDADADAARALDRCAASGTRLFAPGARVTRADVALLRGDVGAATRWLRRDERSAIPRAGFGCGMRGWTEARLRAACDGPVAAAQELDSVAADRSSGRRLLLEPGASAWFVRTALAAGDRSRAEAVTVGAELLATDNPSCGALVAAAAHVRALFDRDAATLSDVALRHVHPLARADAAADAGDAFADADAPSAACEQLEAAMSAYVAMGVDREAARVRALLRRLGVRRRHWRQVDRPIEGWESLTETERRVAGAVSEGLTNRQVGERLFLSRHTVDFHLRHVFCKLSIRSRAELTLIAIEQLAV
jgi:DNA-binding CsgD family transcriptional regulator